MKKSYFRKLNTAVWLIVSLFLFIPGSPAYSQDGKSAPPVKQARKQDKPRVSEQLSDAQKQQVKEILAKFNPNSLDAAQARAIHEAFRQAGLRAGPAMADTIKEAGFDPDKLHDLAPPPEKQTDRAKN